MPRFLYVENDNDAAESASVTAPAPIEGQNQNEPSSPIYSTTYTRLRFGRPGSAGMSWILVPIIRVLLERAY